MQEYNGDFTPKVGTTVVRFPFTGMVGTFSYSIGLALQVPSCLSFDTLSETAVLSQLADEKSSTANVKFQIYENNTKCRTGSPGHTRDRVLTV